MSGVSNKSKKGILRSGWTASVDDYAISGGWALGGEALMVADASGSYDKIVDLFQEYSQFEQDGIKHLPLVVDVQKVLFYVSLLQNAIARYWTKKIKSDTKRMGDTSRLVLKLL